MTPLTQYISYPHVPEANFALAKWYEEQGHGAPAVSFYIRTAEFAEEVGFDEDDSDLLTLAYESLLRAHFCIDSQRTRELTAKSLLQRAIALAPLRPEAYCLLAKFEQRKANWPEVYMLCNIGQSLGTPSLPMSASVGYHGPESFLFPLSLSAYYWGRGTEARKILQEIVTYHKDILTEADKKVAEKLLRKWGVGEAHIADVPYIASEDQGNLRWCFEGLEGVEKNYSQAYQDMFVLTVLNGKRNGTYLEIGSEEPQYKSNTYLLEREFSWHGISVEIDEPEVARFKAERSNPVICADATKLDYTSVLKKANFPEAVDYLQIDTEPSSTSFEVLLTIPFDRYKFAVVTFEHDHAVDFSRTYREKSRRYLRSLGYELVVPDAGPTDWYSFEDWWVHPELVDMERLERLGMVVSSSLTEISGANDVRSYFLV
jgi:hypothetical protein